MDEHEGAHLRQVINNLKQTLHDWERDYNQKQSSLQNENTKLSGYLEQYERKIHEL